MAVFINEDNNIEVDQNGFLEMSDEEKPIFRTLRPYIDEALKRNRDLYNLYSQIEISSDDAMGLFLISSLERLHKDYQAALILALRGLPDQAGAISRSIMEKLFIMQAVFDNPDNLALWSKTQNRELNITRKIIEEGWVNSAIDYERVLEYPTLNETKDVKMREWAKKADMEKDYRVIYSQLSKHIHHSRTDMIDDWEVDNNNYVDAINIGPKTEGIEALISLLLEYFTNAVEIVAAFTGAEVNWTKDWRRLYE